MDPVALIPMVIENTGRGERHMDIFSLLLKERIIFLGTGIDDQIANLIIAQLLWLDSQDQEKEIRMYINSPGGVVYSGLGIYDTIQAIRAPVSTVAVGMTASMGTVLLASGTESCSCPTTTSAWLRPCTRGATSGSTTRCDRLRHAVRRG